MQKTHADWFRSAKKQASSNEDRVTAIFDLDATLFFNIRGQITLDSKPLKFSEKSCEAADPNIFYVDPDAFDEIQVFQKNGHNIMVVTCATYPYESIQRLFKSLGIELTEENYYNRIDIEAVTGKGSVYSVPDPVRGAAKAQFIDTKLKHLAQAMLFDDSPANKPQGSCLFTYTNPLEPFPKFSMHIAAPEPQERITLPAASISAKEHPVLQQKITRKSAHSNHETAYKLTLSSHLIALFHALLNSNNHSAYIHCFYLPFIPALQKTALTKHRELPERFMEDWHQFIEKEGSTALLNTCLHNEFTSVFDEAAWAHLISSITPLSAAITIAIQKAFALAAREIAKKETRAKFNTLSEITPITYSSEEAYDLIKGSSNSSCFFSQLSGEPKQVKAAEHSLILAEKLENIQNQISARKRAAR